MTLKKLHSLVSVALISGALCLSAAPAQADSLFGISDRDRLNSMESVGSPFTRALAAEYRALSNFEYNDMYDHSDGNLFAQKGVQAALGNVVIPEKPDNWRSEKCAKIKWLKYSVFTGTTNGGYNSGQ